MKQVDLSEWTIVLVFSFSQGEVERVDSTWKRVHIIF